MSEWASDDLAKMNQVYAHTTPLFREHIIDADNRLSSLSVSEEGEERLQEQFARFRTKDYNERMFRVVTAIAYADSIDNQLNMRSAIKDLPDEDDTMPLMGDFSD